MAGAPEKRLPVPSAWEAHTPDKLTEGPAVYRRSFQVPPGWLTGRRLFLEFGAVSFHTAIRINGHPAGEHRGMWSPFQLDVTTFVQPGENNIEVEVWKPGGRFPIRQTLAGFLPDVATAFGGIWQSVRLRAVDAAIAGLRVLYRPGGAVAVTGQTHGLSDPAAAQVAVEVLDGNGGLLASARSPVDRASGAFSVELDTDGLPRWRRDSPALHDLSVTAWQGGQRAALASRRVGLRDVTVSSGAAWLDGEPLHLRGVLDWGWHPEIIRPAPSRDDVLRQIGQARALGFNMTKLCLFVPDEVTFQTADGAGHFLWLEMPMWLPDLTASTRSLALEEYAAVFRRVHHHPSIVALSLGCELNADADADFLQSLHELARAWFPTVLLCDNSGSAEAYGGATTPAPDFYDYHFYTDPHFFQLLVDHFERGYRPSRPWLYGEFCDADTGRDFQALESEPWWLTNPVALERDDFLYTRAYRKRLAAAGITDGGAALTRTGRRQATAVRKFILELTRGRNASGGYVVSGWVDTPITSSGIVDDRGELKFSPDDWQMFNADVVLLMDRERRRRWVSGGDRPAYRDPFSWWMGEQAEAHLALSNSLGDVAEGQLTWRLTDEAGREVSRGSQAVGALPAAQVSELVTLPLALPTMAQARPAQLRLDSELEFGLSAGDSRKVSNRWLIWAVPRPDLGGPLALDGAARLSERFDLARLDRRAHLIDASQAGLAVPTLATELSETVLSRVQAGAMAAVWLTETSPRLTRRLPFWREAIHVFEAHPLWENVPQPGYADMRFFSVASDLALDLAGVQELLGPRAKLRPVWRRFDARALSWAEYLIEVQYGAGRLFVSSLRFAGGLGRQPEGFDVNPLGAWMLASLLKAPEL